MFHSNGGFTHDAVYNMPVWLRRFHIKKINQYHKEQAEADEAAQQGKPSVPRPDIN